MTAMPGKIQVYTGSGKGKTTAALGLALRASGAGYNIFIGQFIKGMKYSELKTVADIKNIQLEQFGRNCFIKGDPEPEDIRQARQGLERSAEILQAGNYQLVILDEATIALKYELFDLEELMEVINARAAGVEVVITGRDAPEKLIATADLVTEMKEIKHYYRQGVKARRGIEN